MPSPTQRRGGLAEDQAVLFLQTRGYIILGRHLTGRYGEIDILAMDRGVIVAVEVKYRRTDRFGSASEAMTEKKIQRLVATLQEELVRRRCEHAPYRIDLIAIDGNRITHITHVESPEVAAGL